MKRSAFKKAFALMLALVLALAMAMPAFAAAPSDDDGDEFTITITPGTYTDKSKTNRYKAYEIFTGKLTEPKEDTNDDEEINEDDLSEFQKNQLADIKWGKDIDVAAFTAALIEDENDYFNGAFAGLSDFEADYTADKCASKVLEILSEKGNPSIPDEATAEEIAAAQDAAKAFAKSFAIVAQENLKNPARPVSSTYDALSDRFTIVVDKPGYYLITDEPGDGTAKRDTISEHILQVVRNRQVGVKSDAPTSKKEKVSDDGGYEIGEPITYRLIGTLADNFANYTNPYKYIFHDTMSDGLTLDAASVKVEVWSLKADGTLDAKQNITLTEDETPDDNSDDGNYIVTVTRADFDGDETTTETQLTVTFDNLKEIAGLKAEYAIVVTYDACINDKAIVGTPEENVFYLEFSNDPYKQDSTNETPEDKEVAETFEVDIVKMDSVTKDTLEGVQFCLYKMVDIDPAPLEGDTAKKMYGIFDETKAETGLYTLLETDGWTETAASATTLETIAGGILNLKGLGEGTYYLEETEGFNGYNTLPGPIEIQIEATYVSAADVAAAQLEGVTLSEGEVKSTTVTVSIEGNLLAEFDTERAADLDPAFIPVNVYNVPASSGPGTGGIGNYIFYIGGGCLLAVAAIMFFIVSRRKTSKAA